MELAFSDIIIEEGLGKKFKWFLAISLLLHGAVIYFFAAILPGLESGREYRPPVMTVTMVAVPSGGAQPATTKKEPVKPKTAPAPPPEPKVEPAPEPETPPTKIPAPEPPEEVPAIGPVKPKETAKPEIKKDETPPPKPKVEPKPKPKPQTEIKPKPKATPKAKPKPKPKPKTNIKKRLAQIENKVNAQKEEEHLSQALAKIENQQGPGEGPAAGLQGTGPLTEMDSRLRDYIIVLTNIVNSNWNMPPESLVGSSKDLEAIYVVQIHRSGQVAGAWFERKSGQEHFDKSVERAIGKSQFPPLPDEYDKQLLELGLRFTPSGLRH